MDKKMELMVTNELLLALLNQLYSIELLLADVYNGKANLRYSNDMLEKDRQILDSFTELIDEIRKNNNGKTAAL